MDTYLTGSPDRSLGFRMREDLRISRHRYRGEESVVVGDMLAIEHYRLNEQEFALLQSIDGKHSIHEIQEAFEANFAPHKITVHEIQAYLIDFHKKGLVSAPNSDVGRHLHRLGERRRWKQRLGSMKNLLAIRWRGINPDRIFRFLVPLVGWLFSAPMVVANVMLMIAALLWLGTHSDEFVQRLPAMQEFFSKRNWMMLALVMTGLKILHEFGHGIVFTRYGGRCHELGVMLLVFMPTLYVNTSEAWQIRNKWQRAAIAAAGVYVELTLAALATFGWWYSQAGTFQYLCLNVMFLGSVSAVIFNGNPLLKFDGYHLLCDVAELPNLQERSRTYVRNQVLRHAMGVYEGDDDLLPNHTRRWLALYLCASFAYRFVLVYAIAFILVGVFQPAGLQDLAKMFSFITMALLIGMPVFMLGKYFWVPGRVHKIRRGRASISLMIVVAAFAVFFCVPFPDSVVCDFAIIPQGSKTVFVHHDAQLEQIHVQPKQWVNQGDKIATLRNLDVELEIAQLSGELSELEHQQRMLRLARFGSKSSGSEMSDVRERKLTIVQRLAELQQVQTHMVLRAPISGNVIARWQQREPLLAADQLDSWNGSPLHNENRHTLLQRGQAICEIGDLSHPEARLVVDQSDVKLIAVGQAVELLLDSHAGHSLHGRIDSISRGHAEQISSASAQEFGGSIETQTSQQDVPHEITDSNNVRPSGAVYEAFVLLPEREVPFEAGIRGTARIAIGNRTAAGRVYRFLQRTFRIDL